MTTSDRLWRSLAVLLLAVTFASSIPLLLRCFCLPEIDYNEGWNAFRQVQAWVPRALYGHRPELSITNYPPLSFHFVGAFVWLGADPVMVGRCVSLLAILIVGVAIYSILRQFGQSRAVSACGLLEWIGGIEFWTPQRFGADDPQLLGMAFEAVAACLFLRHLGRAGRISGAALMVSLGLLTKHNVLAWPLALTLSLVARRAWRLLAFWIGAGFLSSAALITCIIVYDGPLLLQHVFQPRPVVLAHAIRLTALYSAVSSPALVAVALWGWRKRRSRIVGPLLCAWVFSLLEIVIFSGGDGVGVSIFQEAIMLTALLQPIALKDLAAPTGWTRGKVGRYAELLPYSLVILPLLLALQTGAEWRKIGFYGQRATEAERGAKLLHGASGPVACEDLLMCFRAGRTSAFDAYYVLDQIKLGRLQPEIVDAQVRQRRLALVEIGCVDDPDRAGRSPSRFTPSFLAALNANYRPLLRGAVFSIYGPR